MFKRPFKKAMCSVCMCKSVSELFNQVTRLVLLTLALSDSHNLYNYAEQFSMGRFNWRGQCKMGYVMKTRDHICTLMHSTDKRTPHRLYCFYCCHHGPNELKIDNWHSILSLPVSSVVTSIEMMLDLLMCFSSGVFLHSEQGITWWRCCS